MMMKKPKFCNKCATVLSVILEIKEYDIYTGEEIVASETFKCPNYGKVLGRVNGHFLRVVRLDNSPPTIPGV